MTNSITNHKILFFGEEIPAKQLKKINEHECSKYKDLPARLNNGTFLSDCDGAIKKVIFTIKSKDFEDVKEIIETFILKKDPGIEVFIFAAKHILKNWPKITSDVKLIETSEKVASKWIQDEIMVVKYQKENGEKHTLFLVTEEEKDKKSTGNFDFVKELAEKLTIEDVKTTGATLVGGNMIRFGQHLLVGIDSVERERKKRNFVKFVCQIRRFETKVKKYNINFIGYYSCLKKAKYLSAIANLAELYSTQPLERGCQPIFLKHIDLFIMPIDAKRVIVALPQIVDIPPTNPENTKELEAQKQKISEIFEQETLMRKLADQIPVKTIFVNIPYSYSENIYGYYTNSIIDNRMEQITAYVPMYATKTPSFEELENQFLYKLMCMGIRIKKMANFSHISREYDGGGALRCMMKVIERK